MFSSTKLSSYFSTKDAIPGSLKSNVVYHFTCAGCNASYVGQTSRHFDVRVHEHLNKATQPSSIYKHLSLNSNCRELSDESCFKILDRDNSAYRLEVKEAIHNEWLKPNINKQKNLLKLSILV